MQPYEFRRKWSRWKGKPKPASSSKTVRDSQSEFSRAEYDPDVIWLVEPLPTSQAPRGR